MFIKYPRTYHLPFSLGKSNDDKVHQDLSVFEGKKLVATLKMDGENTSIYRDGVHARSLSSSNHPSRDWVKKLWSEIFYNIPDNWRICGENLFARHSIPYDELKSYFYAFSIWNGHNTCLSWDETKDWARLFGVEVVEEIASGFTIDDIDYVHSIFMVSHAHDHEGYVIRNMESFDYPEFAQNVGKYVRENHVQTDSHWMHQEIIPNKLKENV